MSYLAFILVLGVLIFVHELGHFMAAKAVGIGVPRFSIGLGPITPLRFTRGETEYVLSWIPFGGYVKMASEEELSELEALEGGEVETPFPPEARFENKSLAARILVISAGVIMNALFAWFAYSVIAYAYGVSETPTRKVAEVDAELLPASAAALRDLPFGSEVQRINGQEIRSWQSLIAGIRGATSDQIRFELAGADPVVIDITTDDERERIASALTPLIEPRIGAALEGRPAAAAGLLAGDLIWKIDGKEIRTWTEMVEVISDSAGQTLLLTVDRDGENLEVPVTPASETARDPATGETRSVGRIGITPATLRVRYGLGKSIAEGLGQTGRFSGLVLATLRGMIFGQISARELGGPVLIAQMSAQAARTGFDTLLRLMAFLSVNLAILNLLPIPVLDGGHLVFLLLEGIRGGRPVSKPLRQRLTMAGFYLLMGLMLFLVVNDLLR